MIYNYHNVPSYINSRHLFRLILIFADMKIYVKKVVRHVNNFSCILYSLNFWKLSFFSKIIDAIILPPAIQKESMSVSDRLWYCIILIKINWLFLF